MSDNERTVVSRGENFVEFSDGTLRIDNVRISFPHFDKPFSKPNKDGTIPEPKYGVQAIAPKDTHKAAKDKCVEIINRLCKQNDVAKLPADKKFIRNGDDLARDEYENAWVISARESRQPRFRKGKQRLTGQQAQETIYAGCIGSVLIRPWWQDAKGGYGNRVNAGLSAVAFIKDGEPLAKGRISDEDIDDTFGDLDVDDSGFDVDDEL